MRPARCGSWSESGGFTLVEALVALAVLGGGVIGVVGTFSLCASTAADNQRLAGAVATAQRELAAAIVRPTARGEGSDDSYRWKVQRQDEQMDLERVAVTVTWPSRGQQRQYMLEQLCLKRARQ